jgi:hypothetical protein
MKYRTKYPGGQEYSTEDRISALRVLRLVFGMNAVRSNRALLAAENLVASDPKGVAEIPSEDGRHTMEVSH